MYSEAEIDIKDIESEIGARSSTVSRRNAVFTLLLMTDMISKNTERDIKAHVPHDKNTETRRYVKGNFCVIGMRCPWLTVIWTFEIRTSRREGEFHFIEYTVKAAV